MYTLRIINRFFVALLFSAILFAKSNDDVVIEKNIDSLNTLMKKSPERAIRYARELLKKLEPGM